MLHNYPAQEVKKLVPFFFFFLIALLGLFFKKTMYLFISCSKSSLLHMAFSFSLPVLIQAYSLVAVRGLLLLQSTGSRAQAS